MTRKLSKLVQRAFDEWILAETWNKSHPNDEARFHAFVWAVIRFARHRPSEAELRGYIYAARCNGSPSEWLQEEALRFSRLYETLYEFGKARNARRLLPLELTDGTATAPPA